MYTSECWYIFDRVLMVFFKQKTAYEMRISDWSSDVCSSDLLGAAKPAQDRLRVGGFCLHRGCIFDHLVILLLDLIPVDRTGEDRLQVGKPRSHADIGKSQLLASDRFQAGCKLKSEKPAKC